MSARVWDYWLGGKDHYEIDRAAGERVAELFPGIMLAARADRAFLGRAIRLLGGQEGIRQYLDIGTGLPTAENTHEIAQRIAPESRIVYVDNDPIVLVHAQALLTSAPEGVTAYLDADLREPEKILQAAGATLDFTRPVALMLLAVLHLVTDDQEAYDIVGTLVDALPSGSFLVFSHACIDVADAHVAVKAWNDTGTPHKVKARSSAEIAGFFRGLDLLDPGVVTCPQWRPVPAGVPTEVMTFCGVARKP